ncbi:nucleotidyl transferase AbiEii/AbiGii toxin family protein [soil metagenome]
MQNFLSKAPEERRLVFEQTEARIGLPARSIEKDFWVCWTLRQLFELPEFGDHLTFKGGTSLSKAWKLIERFSEDIDLVFGKDFLGFGGERDPEAASSNNKRKEGIAALKEECSRRIRETFMPMLRGRLEAALPANEKWDLHMDVTDAERQTVLFDYPTCWPGGTGRYLAPTVKIEMGARSDDWPAQEVEIISYAAETFPEMIPDQLCRVRVLAAERTFWEKATLLHEETCRPVDKPRKRPMARHYYDLWCLICAGTGAKAMEDEALFQRVVEHRQKFFPWTWVDYATMRRGSLRIVPLESQVGEWRKDYEQMRSEMFFGPTPSFDEILEVVGAFQREFNKGPA